MGSSRFDSWSRRRVGFAAGGLAAAQLGAGLGNDAYAKKRPKKHQKNRCKRVGERCVVSGKRGCCVGLSCDVVGGGDAPEMFCCRANGAPCQVDDDCCQRQICDEGECSILI